MPKTGEADMGRQGLLSVTLGPGIELGQGWDRADGGDVEVDQAGALGVDTFDSVVDQLSILCHGEAANAGLKGPRREPMPSSDVLVEVVHAIRSVLFPGYFGTAELDARSMRFHVGSNLDRVRRLLMEQVRRGFCFQCDQQSSGACQDCDLRARSITARFLARLPDVKAALLSDVSAFYGADPASDSPDEVVFSYPGLLAITSYRLAHELYRLGVPLIPRMITEHAHSVTGIDIHPGASIGGRFFIDHGTGVVVGQTCRLGEGVKLYQGVTLGAKRIPVDENGDPFKGVPRHPIVEDDVVIYAGATILGRVTIGARSVIGGNVWLTRDVSPDSRVTQAQAEETHFEQGAGI